MFFAVIHSFKSYILLWCWRHIGLPLWTFILVVSLRRWKCSALVLLGGGNHATLNWHYSTALTATVTCISSIIIVHFLVIYIETSGVVPVGVMVAPTSVYTRVLASFWWVWDLCHIIETLVIELVMWHLLKTWSTSYSWHTLILILL